MRLNPSSWWRLVQSLGDAAIDLVGAEIAAVRSDLEASSRRLGRGLGLLAIAAALLFWAVGLLSLAAIEILALWWPRWASVLIVATVFLVLVAILARWGSHVLGELEGPAATVRRRWDEHQEWWRERILEDKRRLSDEPTAKGLDADSEAKR